MIGSLVGLSLLKVACSTGTPGEDPTATEQVRAVLADAGTLVILPALTRAEAAAVALETAAGVWETAATSAEGASEAQAAARTAWEEALLAWQEVEVLQIGPAASSLTAAGGEDRRDRIYAWPTVNRCRVDQETVAARWDSPDYLQTSLVNVLGFAALEVLLYAPEGENACPSQVDINVSGAWDALGPEGVQRARASQARALAGYLRADVTTLRERWAPEGGDWAGTLAQAGSEGSPFPSAQAGVNAIFDAIFYLESVVKDRKLGYALGVGDCTGDSCLSQVESPVAGASHRWIPANLRAVRALYTGGDGAGLDDLLVEAGAEDVATDVLLALDAADAAALALTMPLEVAVTQDRAAVEALHARLDELGDLLTGDVATLLLLQVPQEAAGDND